MLGFSTKHNWQAHLEHHQEMRILCQECELPTNLQAISRLSDVRPAFFPPSPVPTGEGRDEGNSNVLDKQSTSGFIAARFQSTLSASLILNELTCFQVAAAGVRLGHGFAMSDAE